MTIPFSCPHCGHSSNVADQFAGQTGPCSACGVKITIPALGAKMGGGPKKSTSAPIFVIVGVVLLGTFVVCGGVGTALLLPAVQAAREAARRVSCTNNVKQITLAMHNYHDVYRSFPPAYTVDANGKKLHSWRTLLLPYLEQQAIYDQIDLTKPWDDPVNRRFADMAIEIYRCPSHPGSTPSATNYMVVVGEGTIMEGDRPVSMAEILDGTSNTLLVLEVKDKNSSWMAPVDLELSKMKMAINGGPDEISSFHPGGVNAGFADGSSRFISETIDSPTLRNLTTRADGNAVPAIGL